MELNPEKKHNTAESCVSVINKGGRGVLVPGNLVLTAAHCINYDLEGGMAVGEWYIETIKTASHGELKVRPLAVEPVMDIAVLGAMDDQEAPDHAASFEAWCDATTPVPLSWEDLPPLEEFPVFVYTHRQVWIRGRAQQFGFNPVLMIEMEEHIEGGTSGSPVVSIDGALVGIVSWAGGAAADNTRRVSAPRPNLTLSVWIVQQIMAKQNVSPNSV